ncbi:DoxX family protein [soil metagenome]
MKNVSLFVMSALYILAGINHFWHPEFYLAIMPPWISWHRELVLISGIAEFTFGFLLLFTTTRRIAAWAIILLLIAVFPANIQMMLNYWEESNPKLWVTILRLPLQIILIRWAYAFTKQYQKKVRNLG